MVHGGPQSGEERPRTLRTAVGKVPVVVGLPAAVVILAESLPGPRGDGGLLQHMMVRGDDDAVGVSKILQTELKKAEVLVETESVK